MKPVSSKCIFAEVASELHLDVFTHCLMWLRGTWSALTCSYKQGKYFRMAEYGSCHTLAQLGAVKNYPNESTISFVSTSMQECTIFIQIKAEAHVKYASLR